MNSVLRTCGKEQPSFLGSPPEYGEVVVSWELAEGKKVELLRDEHQLNYRLNCLGKEPQIDPIELETDCNIWELACTLVDDCYPVIEFREGKDMIRFERIQRLVNPRYRSAVNCGAIVTSLAITGLLVPLETARILGMTILTGFAYGVVNDMIACRDCIEYFTIGHIYDGKKLRRRPIETLNPNLNAVVWGSIATWPVCAIAGALFAAVARIPFPGLAVKITAIQLAPYLITGAAISLVIAHTMSRLAKASMERSPCLKHIFIPLEFQAGWEACNVRNTAGYCAIGLGGILLPIALIAARAGLFVL